MSVFSIYLRVLRQLKPDATLAYVLVAANLALAAAQFAEPVLFGRIIDLMTNSQASGAALTWGDLLRSFWHGPASAFSRSAPLSPLAFTLTGFHIAAVSP